MSDEPVYVDGFDEALIGVGYQFAKKMAVYDFQMCVGILMERDGMTKDEAVEFMHYNVLGAYVGDNTPVFVGVDEQTPLFVWGEI
jgi:hypothetical protein